MTPEEAALTGMIDWFKDGMYLKADETGKISDDQVVLNIIEIINRYTNSKEERKVWYRGGKAGDLIVSESNSTKSIFRVEECGKVDEPLKFTGKAPWLEVAWKEFETYKGLIEKQSPLKEKISIYFQAANSSLNYKAAWCAAFITWCFKQTEYSDITPVGSTFAFAYTEENSPKAKSRKIKGWVQGQLSEPFVGALIVFNYSHVAILVGENKAGTSYVYLGGNQGDDRTNYQKICLGSVKKNSTTIYALMKPKKYQISEDEKKLPKYDVDAENSGNSSR